MHVTNHIGKFTKTENPIGSNDPCEQRAKTLGETIANASPAYDIIGLQEYYNTYDLALKTCDANHLRDAIQSKGDYRNSDNRYLFKPNGEFTQLEIDGGLGIFTRYPIEETEENEWQDSYWFLQSPLQGFIFARIKIPGTPVTIDTYVVHTYSESADGCDAACKQIAIEQLAQRIKELSSASGNPVLVMGDFNIAGPSDVSNGPDYTDYPLYQTLMRTLGDPRDLWLENHPDAVTKGYTRDDCWIGLPSDCSAGNGKRIDYIFLLTDPSFTNSPYELFIKNRDDIGVVVWNDGFGYHVSDHFGVEATIEIRERSTEQDPFSEIMQPRDKVNAQLNPSVMANDGPRKMRIPVSTSKRPRFQATFNRLLR